MEDSLPIRDGYTIIRSFTICPKCFYIPHLTKPEHKDRCQCRELFDDTRVRIYYGNPVLMALIVARNRVSIHEQDSERDNCGDSGDRAGPAVAESVQAGDSD